MVAALLVATLLAAEKHKHGLRGVPIFGAKSNPSHKLPHNVEAQAEMVAFLKELGYPQYATPEFVKRLEDEVAYDSIDDLAYLEDDEDYKQLGIPEDDAEKIQEAALKEMLRRFLRNLPSGSMEAHLDALYEAGHEEIEDLEDLDEEDMEDTGLTMEQITLLVDAATVHRSRLTLTVLHVTYRDEKGGPTPFRDPEVHKPMVEALLKAGVRTWVDVARAKPGSVPGLADADLARLQTDVRVVAQAVKSEL